ncbi:MAG: zf-HC2 domain-containing protein, partial [Dehalococcoidia bacterium]
MNPLNLTQTLARLLRPHPVRREDLSAYLDGRLAPPERARVEEHLAACGRCRQELEELRTVVRALRGLSQVPVPRSFRLSPAQVETARPAARPTWAYGALGAASAAATIIFAVLLSGDLLTTDGLDEAITPDGGPPAALIGRQAEEAAEAGEGLPAEADLTAEETPPPEPTMEAPAEAFAPAMPAQPPEAEDAEKAAAAEEENGGIGRIAL